MTARPDAALPAEADKAEAVRTMFDTIAPRYDLVNRVMTFGLDVRWRRRLIEALALERGSVVADLACGTGDFCRELAAAGHRPVGFDLSFGMLAHARTSAPLTHADITTLPLPSGAVDAVVCGYALRNVAELGEVLDEMGRIVRPGGRLGILEVDRPAGSLVRWGHSAYFDRVVPVVGGVLSDGDAYRYLPASTAYLPDATTLLRRLSDAGFHGLRRQIVGLGASQIITASRR